MKEYLQKILISTVQITIEWLKVVFLSLFTGFFIKLSIILYGFSTIKNNITESIFFALYGIFLDLTVSYLFAIPIILYKSLIPSKFKYTTLNRVIYLCIFYIVTLSLITINATDMMLFLYNQTKLHMYLTEINYYKNLIVIDGTLYFIILNILLVTFYLTNVIGKKYSKLRFKYETSIQMKLTIATILIFSLHLLFVTFINISPQKISQNRYTNLLSKNTIVQYSKPIFKIKNTIKIPEYEALSTKESDIFNINKNINNVVVFFVKNLSNDNLYQMPKITKIANKGLYFSNCISFSKIITKEINAILSSNIKQDTVNILDANYKKTFTTDTDQYTSAFIDKSIKKYNFKKIEKITELRDIKNILFYFTDQHKGDEIVSNFINNSKKNNSFDRTAFIIIGLNNNQYSSKTTDLDSYKAPIIIYAPAIFSRANLNNLVSTIELMPTIADLLGISYKAKGAARSILDTSKKQAFIEEDDVFLYVNHNAKHTYKK